MKFFKKFQKTVKKIESASKKLKQKIFNDKKIKKVVTDAKRVLPIALPIVSPFVLPFANTIPIINRIPNLDTNEIIEKGINLLNKI